MRRLLLVRDIYRGPDPPDPEWLVSLRGKFECTVISWRRDWGGSGSLAVRWRDRVRGVPIRLELIARALWLGRRYDAVVFHMPPPGILVAALLRVLRWSYGQIVLLSLIDYEKHGLRRLENLLTRWALPRVSAITVGSEPARQALARTHGPDVLPRIHVLTDPAFGEELGTPEAPADQPAGYVFAGGSSLRDWPLLAAAARLSPEVSFVVIASSNDPATSSAAWPANVRVLLDQPEREFWRWLRHAVLTVLPVRDPEAPVGMLFVGHSFHAERALIATESVVSRQYVVPGRNGVVVPSGDAESLASSIKQLLTHDRERHELERGAAASADSFTMSAYCRGLEAIIDGLWGATTRTGSAE